ncbi:MAG TPA: hypothetical protein VFI41_05230 [Gemmatimonadales bacterium]|nr:hypothetical protein [Gemmatimonadales bacterium]
MAPKNEWIEVDLAGLASQIEEPARLGLELWQNAVDENVTKVAILITAGERGTAKLVVEDDSPEGFADLTESYKMFAQSKKRNDPTKRGRMNIGEKRVLALCREAVITSTTGRVIFRNDGTRQFNARAKTAAGTRFEATIRWNQEEQREAIALLRSVLVPEGVELTVNGAPVEPRPAVREVEATLNTVLPDADGNLRRRTRRKTTVRLVEPQGAELPMIYELGIPVVEHDGRYHIDVQQRVPLNTERDNVPPTYLRELREIVLNASHDLLAPEDSHAAWVADALPNASPEALQSFVKARYGDNVVVRDNSTPQAREATLRAVEAGYSVIEGRHLPKGVVSQLREANIVQPAVAIPKFQRFTEYHAGGEDISVPEDQWTPGMRAVVAYTKSLSGELLGYECGVTIERYPFTESNHLANFGSRHLRFNLSRLSHRFFNDGTQREVDKLLIHEFSHHFASNHWSDEFIDALERMGSELRSCKSELASFREVV